MSSSTASVREATATSVTIRDDTLTVELTDGRTISAPTAWYPRLVHATPTERKTWRLLGGGRGIHWPALDEDISIANLLGGKRSAESKTSLKRWLTNRRKPKDSRQRTQTSVSRTQSPPRNDSRRR